jgi:hypothetical protein
MINSNLCRLSRYTSDTKFNAENSTLSKNLRRENLKIIRLTSLEYNQSGWIDTRKYRSGYKSGIVCYSRATQPPGAPRYNPCQHRNTQSDSRYNQQVHWTHRQDRSSPAIRRATKTLLHTSHTHTHNSQLHRLHNKHFHTSYQ